MPLHSERTGATRLIVNGDDFGWTRGITDGILRAHQDGFLTSTSLIANQDASEYAVEQSRRYPRLGLGVHLNLCSGKSVLPRDKVPSLVRADGTFHEVNEMLRRLKTWRVSSREIEAEFRAQIRWGRERGANLTHADSHYHVHLFPAALYPFRRALKAEGIHAIRTPRHTVSPNQMLLPLYHSGPWYRQLAVWTYMVGLRKGTLRTFKSPDFRVELAPAYRRDPNSLMDGWRLAFENLPPGCYELCCHPGLRDSGFPETDHLRERRELELRLLTSPELRSVIECCGIRLVNYRDLC